MSAGYRQRPVSRCTSAGPRSTSTLGPPAGGDRPAAHQSAARPRVGRSVALRRRRGHLARQRRDPRSGLSLGPAGRSLEC
eukprot:8128050-Alexandrium_andersonii.AAC.1